MDEQTLKSFLDERLARYNQPAFIPADPICIPHRFSKKQDIEIAGFFAATLAWGRRSTIIANTGRILHWMDDAPHQFILQHLPQDLKRMLGFAHRTFNATDLLYFIERLQLHYQQHASLEDAFVPQAALTAANIGPTLIHFHNYFFALEHPSRSRKHLSTPLRGSACKRLCMFLRWMVRNDSAGVDFGIWQKISAAQLIIPMDVHVARVACRLGLLASEKASWTTATALTDKLRHWRPEDPVAYDFALFSLGAEEHL
ncbi:MAG: TIGR02757 family protein [Bacteroidetes bacterium]|nr:TIGR02757 family protein [Bacteroidota bacterium]